MPAIPVGPYHEPFACRRIREALRNAGVEVFSKPYAGVRLCRGANNFPCTRERARARHGVINPIPFPLAERPITPRSKSDDQRSKRARGSAALAHGSAGHASASRWRTANARTTVAYRPDRKAKAGRQRISQAQKQRWAAFRSARMNGEVRPAMSSRAEDRNTILACVNDFEDPDQLVDFLVHCRITSDDIARARRRHRRSGPGPLRASWRLRHRRCCA